MSRRFGWKEAMVTLGLMGGAGAISHDAGERQLPKGKDDSAEMALPPVAPDAEAEPGSEIAPQEPLHADPRHTQKEALVPEPTPGELEFTAKAREFFAKTPEQIKKETLELVIESLKDLPGYDDRVMRLDQEEDEIWRKKDAGEIDSGTAEVKIRAISDEREEIERQAQKDNFVAFSFNTYDISIGEGICVKGPSNFVLNIFTNDQGSVRVDLMEMITDTRHEDFNLERAEVDNVDPAQVPDFAYELFRLIGHRSQLTPEQYKEAQLKLFAKYDMSHDPSVPHESQRR